MGAWASLAGCLVAGGLVIATCSPSDATAIQMRDDGELSIDGRRVSCKSDVRTILDAKLPNLGIATRSLLVLNPQLLSRYSSTVRLFVYHHECGHHHVGGDEMSADCWAVRSGVASGWLRERQLQEICASFGNAKATATHPATAPRCRALRACYADAMRAPQQKPPSHQTEVAKGSPAPSPQLLHEGFAAPASLPQER